MQERLEALDPAQTVLVGWSLGGMLALDYAAKFPGSVKGLVLVGSGGTSWASFAEAFSDNMSARMSPDDLAAQDYWSQPAVIAKDPLRAAIEGIRAMLPSQFYDRTKAHEAIAIFKAGIEHYNPKAGEHLIPAYEQGTAPAFELYGLGLKHKHIPEIMACTGLTRRPLVVPSVGNFRQGMLVELPLHLDLLPGRPNADDLHKALARHYADSEWVKVLPATADNKLDAVALADTNQLELRVFANRDAGDGFRHAVLVARLDNLGKGASGAAVQNLQLMLGL